MKKYVENAGSCIVTKSILNGETKFRWLFREEPLNNIDTGWMAFGDSDNDDYVNDPKNLTAVDLNTLINIEPTILNVYEMPIGTDLIFIEEDGDKYFINAKTNEQIREKVKSPFMIAFEKNLSFLRKDEYSKEFIENLFTESNRISLHTVGEVDFPTGQVIIADPLCYLHSEENRKILDRTIPIGKYEVELAILNSKTISKRVVGARLKIKNDKIIRYEQTQNKSSSFNGFGVDAGLASFCDATVAEEYTKFYSNNDYFIKLLQGKQFIDWEIPGTNHKIAMFETGFGDGYYMSLYGLNEKDEVCELVIPFINPELVD
ncbi:MAG: DUF2185 domain-containing protein [Fusobacterium periodonticum]|nr:DUF2185 domain-containing protein [Fusobacterium periodonticum]